MSQNDFNIANQGFPATRADINSALQALASNSSGATAPGTTYAYQFWYDTSTDILKMRNADNDAWIDFASFDQANDRWEVRTAVVQAVDSAGVVIKTDDGVARISVADSGVVTIGSSVLTTTDINGGTIDGTVIGGATPAAISGTTGSFTGNLTVAGETLLDTNALYIRVRDAGGAAPRSFGMNASNQFFVGPIDAYAGGPIFYGSSASVNTHIFRTGGIERAKIDSAGNFFFNSGYGSSAVAYGCRAWVNFNGTGTVAIRGSGNVSSITDNATGDYTVNFATAMPDENYSSVITVANTSGSTTTVRSLSLGTTTSQRFQNASTAGTLLDVNNIQVAIFR